MHLIGKEISRFHCVYWPAFLMAAGIDVPRSVKANGWLLFDQGKMSKSKGNIVRAETVQEVLGADALRYFLLREIPFGQDGNFSFDALVQRYNGDLANGYGNLVSRVVNMVHKYFGGVVPEAGAVNCIAEGPCVGMRRAQLQRFGPAFDELNFSDALKVLWVLVAETDGYLTAQRAVEEAGGSQRCGPCSAAGAGAGNGCRGYSHYYGAGVSNFARVGGKGLAATGAGRHCGCRTQCFFDGTRVGRIEGGNEIWRAGAAVSARGEGCGGTYAKS